MSDAPPPAAVFGLLSDEIRVDILEAIAVAEAETETRSSGRTELAFSDIYERVDVDNTSKLSYHLGELVGPFLRKTDAGYSFTHAGEKFVRMILADNYEHLPAFDPVTIDGHCMYCDSTELEASLRFQFFIVTCRNCERALSGHPIAPTLVRAHDGDELVDRVASKMALDYRQIRNGLCVACTGDLSTTVIDTEGLPVEDIHSFLVRDECNHCLREYNGPMAYGVAYHPASIAFHWEHGIDLSTRGMWELHEFAAQWTAEQLSDDPAEYRVVLSHDSDELRFYLDADARVTRTERVRGRTVD
ncbi:hypothetical protein SAMN05216226_105177 [Halovenus aranensis]|uniref:Uncharacterized protein n=1 Tax=Halovenus aranensis TaxID=890420 RepID=A0A1G8UX47_9EURY|nr:helix-turn-helix transcriptional regulator [Halovenus aranensis]SDJ58378.1 hypothetical protein SAMN05216226_105177 [Halovenus aranensis]